MKRTPPPIVILAFFPAVFVLPTAGCVIDPGLGQGTETDAADTSAAETSQMPTDGVDSSDDGSDSSGATQDCDVEDWDFVQDTTLFAVCSPYTVVGSATVSQGATLTIEPGVELRFDDGEWLEVGDGTQGSLVADGTADAPIVFTSSMPETAERGAWHGLVFGDDTLAGSSVSNATVRFGGRDGFGVLGCITVRDSAPGVLTLADLILEQCELSGVGVDAGALNGITDLTFVDSDAGLRMAAHNVGDIGQAFTYTETSHNIIDGERLEADTTWVAQGVPWAVNGSIDVQGVDAPVLTLSAGIHVQFSDGEWIEVADGQAGGLVMAGTETDPILLEARTVGAVAGAWHGVAFREDTTAGSSLDYVHVRHAGRDGFGVRGCVTLDQTAVGRVSVTNSTFEMCEQSGIAAWGPTAAPMELDANTFIDSEAGMWLNANTLGGVSGAQTYTNVAINRMQGDVVTDSTTWVGQAVPYDVAGSISVEGMDPVLTLDAGLTLRFADGEWLEVGDGLGGGLMVAGTAGAPVVMTSVNPVPSPGDWHGLYLRDQTLPGTIVEFLTLEFAGRAGFGVRGGVTLLDSGSSVEIDDSTFDQNLQADVYVDCGSSPALGDNTYASAGLEFEGNCP